MDFLTNRTKVKSALKGSALKGLLLYPKNSEKNNFWGEYLLTYLENSLFFPIFWEVCTPYFIFWSAIICFSQQKFQKICSEQCFVDANPREEHPNLTQTQGLTPKLNPLKRFLISIEKAHMIIKKFQKDLDNNSPRWAKDSTQK